MRELLHLLARHRAARAEGRAMVLATLCATSGSTYRRPSAMALCIEGGEVVGLLSGGCVEADLSLRAARMSAAASLVEYDLRGIPDPFGVGLGCEGTLAVLLERLDGRAPDPLDRLRSALEARAQGATALVFDGSAIGARVTLVGTDLHVDATFDAATGDTLHAACRDVAARAVPLALDAPRTLVAPLPARIHLLVIGAGPDAGPVVATAAAIGFHTTVWDHRPAALARPDLSGADVRVHVTPARLSAMAATTDADAVVVMTHGLALDTAALRGLARTRARYIGLLGPRHRAEAIRAELGGVSFDDRLHGPVGLDIGAEAPEAIALSIVAEIHAVLAGRAGGALSKKVGAIHERAA